MINKASLIVLILNFIFFLIMGVIDNYFRESDLIILVSTLIVTVFMFAWLYFYSKENKFQSNMDKVLILLLSVLYIPIYLLRHLGFKKGMVKIVLLLVYCIACLVGYSVTSIVAAQSQDYYESSSVLHSIKSNDIHNENNRKFQIKYLELINKLGDTFMIIDVNFESVIVPRRFADKLVLNMNPEAIGRFVWNEAGFEISVKFSGKDKNLNIPIGSILDIYKVEIDEVRN
ncbi:MAG: hypothetical protein HRU38_05015 [Saccharospirillaceae bacterium]|nr:hypothetical protein [Saccharospirillaceae bacterium]